MLPPDYSFSTQLNVLQYILRYLSIFNRLFSPREKLEVGELRQSMLGWVPRSQIYTLMNFLMTMTDDLTNFNIPLSESYYQIILWETENLNSLRADEEAKKE